MPIAAVPKCTLAVQINDVIEARARSQCARARAQGSAARNADRPGPVYTENVDKVSFLDDLQDRMAALVRNTPAADMQKNVKALLTQQFARLELVTREEFDTQTKVLARTRAKLEELEKRLTEIEAKKR